MRRILFAVVLLLCINIAAGEVLVLSLNKGEFTTGETAVISGAVLDDSLNGVNASNVWVYLDGTLEASLVSDSSGDYSYSLTNLSAGDHNLTANTTSSSQRLTFSVLSAALTPSYQIIASSLTVPFRDPALNFTVKKFLGTILTSDSYTYDVFYANGTAANTNLSGVSGTVETLSLPAKVGLFSVVVDSKKSFTVSVTKFSLKFRITDKAGNPKYTFKPNGVAYFEVEGFSNGQRLTNATVSAVVTDPTTSKKTVTFTENNGVYTGNTNVTSTTPIQLQSGDYDVEFKMQDLSNNEQIIKGFFTVLGLSVDMQLVDKQPYRAGETAEFDVVVKSLETGNLLSHNETSYTIEIVKDGNNYDASAVVSSASTDATKTSRLSLSIPSDLADGHYFLKARAASSGKKGKGSEFFEVANTEVFVELTDNYGDFRDIFKPGELAKATVESNGNMTFVSLIVEDTAGVQQSATNDTPGDTTSAMTFNVPTTQGNYRLAVVATMESGATVTRYRWFKVQNYFSFLDIKNLNNQPQFTFGQGDSFLGDINVFDVTTGQGVDISSFTVKFDKIVNENTQVEYTSIQAVKNTSLSSETTGSATYLITPQSLPYGVYRIDYTLINTVGETFDGNGWFGVSAFDVSVETYDENGQQKKVFPAGKTINVTITLSDPLNGTATIHREFFTPITFDVEEGTGSALLTAASGELPSQSGYYHFGVEVTTDDGQTGLGNSFFEIRNLNFRSISVRSNGQFAPTADIVADVTLEKSGDLVNDTNITVMRVFRAWDMLEVSTSSSANPVLTNNLGRTTVTIDPASTLEPGDYFAEIRATKGTNNVFAGFGFSVVEDKVIITINDDDSIFSSNDNVEINIKVTYQNDTPKNNVTVNLTGLLNFATWGQVTTSKQAATSSNGVASITISAANFNAGRYAPVVAVEGLQNTIVGFGDGEFEIVPLTVAVSFAEDPTFSIAEDLTIYVNVTGEVTVTTAVEDINGVTQTADSFYSSGILTVNNELPPGEYFIDVTITQSSNSKTRRLWFEVLAPWAHIPPLPNPTYDENGTINFTHSVFTQGANGWNPSSGTLVIETVENLWTGNTTTVNTTIAATGQGTSLFDISSYNLGKGDYFLNFVMTENPGYAESLYFRVEKDVSIFVSPIIAENNVTIVVNTTGLSSGTEHYLERYTNYETGTETIVGGGVQATGTDVQFSIGNLDNGFYYAQLRVVDGSDEYYWDVNFDVRVREVTIDGPSDAFVNNNVTFNISSATSSTFWIIDPFTQTVLISQPITPGNTTVNHTFSYPGFFMYSYGDDKWDAFKNHQGLEIMSVGYSVQWPFDDNRYVLTGTKNFTFNVTAGLTDTPLTLRIKNLFTGDVTTRTDLTTHSVANNIKTFSFDIDGDLGLVNGPHDVELVLEDGSSQSPKAFFFIDIFPDQYQMWAWTERWEYNVGENITLRIEVYDILQNWQKQTPDNVVLGRLEDPFGMDVSASMDWAGGGTASIPIGVSWTSGYYHGELNITESGTTKTVPFDLQVRGNDNIELFWNQNKWDYSSNEVFSLRVEARDGGSPVAGVPAQLMAFQQWPEDYDSEPQDQMGNITGAFNFSTADNTTDANGVITFNIDLGTATLPTGGFTGRLNIGGQIVWFDFQQRSYFVDAYPESWEYGISDTVQINVRARNIDNWNPISEDGNVTIERVQRHEPGSWQPVEISPAAFGLQNTQFSVVGGEALLEMQANSTALNITKPYEFELKLSMDLEGSGSSEGWAWFRMSNTDKPNVTLVDNTGSAPESYFSGQTYTVKVTNINSGTIRNIWGPCGGSVNTALVNLSDVFQANITGPNCPGFYDIEIEIARGEGFTEHVYKQFSIGSGMEMNFESDGHAVPEVNFSVMVMLFGEGEDPFCLPENGCNPWGTWFGPLGNKTVTLIGMKDLANFSYINLTVQDLSKKTNGFPSWMIPTSGGGASCDSVSNETVCNQTNDCIWAFNPGQGFDTCMSTQMMCSSFNGDESGCTNAGCDYDIGMNECNSASAPESSSGGGGGEFMDFDEMPGHATFTLNPTVLGMVAGNKYDLIFEYIDDDNESNTGKQLIQVERFHAAISKRERNLGANSGQQVWLQTTDLYGVPLQGCDIIYSSIYDEKNYQLVKTLSINNETDENGSLSFSYTTPSLPGTYVVDGTATCNISGVLITQESGYFIQVGAKSLEVDMKTKINEEEKIKLSFTTKDRLGQPTDQRLEISLYHERADYSQPVYSLGGSDCTSLDANQQWEYMSSGGTFADNRLEITTDASGQYELELCPMPRGTYSVHVFPLFEFGEEGPAGGITEGPKEDESSFDAAFIVSSADITVTSDLIYMVGDNVTLNITAYDGDGLPISGQIVAMKSALGIHDESAIIQRLSDGQTVNVTNGTAQVSYTIPSVAQDKDGENVTVSHGAVDLRFILRDSAGNRFPYENMQYAVRRSAFSTVTAPTSVKTNRMIPIHVETDNLTRFKVQDGVYFLQDNTDKTKDWIIENGVFLQDNGDGSSSADLQILSPREPGSYFIGMLIFDIAKSAFNPDDAAELLVLPIDVTLDLINVTGNVVESDNVTPIDGATVRIGKLETTTAADGTFSMDIPQGKSAIEIERTVQTGNKQFMKTSQHTFDANAEINVTFYGVMLNGSLQQTLFNISSPSVDLSTMRLRINVSINNTGGVELDNVSIRATAMSGDELKNKTFTGYGTGSVFFQNLYAGFEIGTYSLAIKMSETSWDGSSYVLINGQPTNSTVGAILKKSYDVWTYAVAGDNLDNDGDCALNATMVAGCVPHESWVAGTCVDEEVDNNKDDDCDGRIDEDLEGTGYFEWCGNSFCSSEEASSGTCFEDCAQGYCGDSTCQAGEETWCASDCSANVTTCNTPNQCLTDGSPNFCNMWNITEPASWCGSSCDADNCWACGYDECASKGCMLGEEGSNWWCFMQETCGDDACFACKTSGECGGTSVCEWDIDSYSPDGGWCNRPWDCSSECGACNSEPDCTGSAAEMNNASCVWRVDQQGGGWCEWNMTYLPPSSGGGGIIDNIWLGANQSIQDWQAPIDYKCWSGNCGTTVDAGDYFILLHMGDTMVNVTVNGTYVDMIDNTGGWFTDKYTSSTFTFSNGSWLVEIEDLIGPDYIAWTVEIGGNGSSGSSICGNGALEDGEQCDDSNTDDGDGCSSVCESEPSSMLSFSVSKTCVNCPVNVDEYAIFELFVWNNGTVNATDIFIEDQFNNSYLNVTGAIPSWDGLMADGNSVPESVEWNVNLTVNENLTFYINFTAVSNGTTLNQLMVNNNSASGEHFMYKMTNEVINIGSGGGPGPSPSARVVKTCLNCPVEVGEGVLFELKAINNGSVDLNVTLIDEYNTSFLNYTWSDVLYDTLDLLIGMVSWNISTVAGENVTIIANFTAMSAGNTTNYAILNNGTANIGSLWFDFQINPGPQANGGACGDNSSCISGYCNNDFCCDSGECCSISADCPGAYSTAAQCDNMTGCQGYRIDATCSSNQCGSTASIDDDSACNGAVEALTCGYYQSEYCTGAADQSAPTCPVTCSIDGECDANAHCDIVCLEDLSSGQACDEPSDCVSDSCSGGFCD
ncbi:MAG: hypothetical protein ABIC95_05895 [archaeon]